MINAIIKGIFNLITSLFNALLSPVISAITSLFPSLSTFFISITTFLNYCFTYVRSVLSLLCISDTIIIAFFDYIIICYSIYLVVLAIRFGLTVYNKLKI